MNRVRHNQNGFSAIEVIIVIVILAVVGAAGWMVYQNKHKAKPVAATPAASTSTASSNSQSGTYSGWQSYCDTINNGCFKYPANWTLASSNANGLVSVKVTSPGQTATAEYKSYIAGIGNPPQTGAGFYAASASNNLATANSSLQIVGGYFTSSNIPYYYLVDASALTSFPLTSGQTAQFEAIPSYSLNGSDNYGGFYASNTASGASGTAAQAQAWYATSDAKTALQIIQSFTYQ